MKIRIFIVMLCFALGAQAQNETLFVQATKAYNDGNFEKAADYYQEILKNGKHSASLYFNLGNCHYKLNEIGPSIYYFEKALLLRPNDPEILNNLGYAQNMRLDAIDQMPETPWSKLYNNLVNIMTFDQWAYLTVFLVLAFVIAYLLYYALFGATQKRVMFVTSVVSLILAGLSVVFAYLQWQDHLSDNPAIIFEREVVVASEPNERSEKVFTLHEGTKVNVLETLNEWNKIWIADGQTGWIPAESLKLLKDF
ncbi:tetratricopeptide repeat protein [Flagellimonas sp. DF-77]|uniref:SH3 domain-containing protein n=1 Tax=Flagellimonas algarum TaxID=3230298 RepID=UPI0033995FC6